MSCVTNPFTPEPAILQTCRACGQVYHVDNGPDCTCDREHDVS